MGVIYKLSKGRVDQTTPFRQTLEERKSWHKLHGANHVHFAHYRLAALQDATQCVAELIGLVLSSCMYISLGGGFEEGFGLVMGGLVVQVVDGHLHCPLIPHLRGFKKIGSE